MDDPAAVARAIVDLARPMLVGCDVDGTLAPISEQPGTARVLPGVVDLLCQIDSVPGVRVAIVSGRSLAELRGQFGFPSSLITVGSHGAEHDQPAVLTAAEQSMMAELDRHLQRLAERTPGARVEHKPLAVALHVRNAAPADGDWALAAARAVGEHTAGVLVLEGKRVVELAVRHVTKARAITTLRDELGVGAVVFLGDDQSDELVFRSLGGGDLGVKVGDGPTAAAHRLASPHEVFAALRLVADTLSQPS